MMNTWFIMERNPIDVRKFLLSSMTFHFSILLLCDFLSGQEKTYIPFFSFLSSLLNY